MSHRCATFGLSLIGLCCLAAPPVAAFERGRQPLQLGLAAAIAPVARERTRSRLPAASANRSHHLVRADDDVTLGQRAWQSVIAESQLPPDEASIVSNRPENRFRFEKQGHVGRDLSRGYRNMCAKVSNRIWDEPNGRRIKFDIAGKPGVAFEIPLR